jgi:uncharacterized membrane protein YecN with MAPEG domain
MTDFPLYITAWSALILGALLLFLTLRVIGDRRSKKIVYGDNGDKAMLKKIRGHANASEHIPTTLILLGFVEYLQGSVYAAIIATLLVTGRILHAYYFSFDNVHWRFRVTGMQMTLLSQILALLALLRALAF